MPLSGSAAGGTLGATLRSLRVNKHEKQSNTTWAGGRAETYGENGRQADLRADAGSWAGSLVGSRPTQF